METLGPPWIRSTVTLDQINGNCNRHDHARLLRWLKRSLSRVMGGSDGGEGGSIVDCLVGTIVWARRRNGSWCPGRILGAGGALDVASYVAEIGEAGEAFGVEAEVVKLEKLKAIKMKELMLKKMDNKNSTDF
ncbi:uncharacterized protein A4U43_C03F4210 [Asparagus officinalis]|uniref:Uncharacterized protein n=1 Tax=Asparagus officinalis TaxID=4686 RepID=A0A5P1F793_ASPOF|nr:uncharacterized protein A4U43_C03F4210 [Asparagus officinalis]